MLARAKATLDSGLFARAESIYDSTIALAQQPSLKGDAYFGRAYAAQRRLMADSDSLSAADAKRIADDYRSAVSLHPALAAAARSNESVALQAGGLKEDAVKALQRLRPVQGRGTDGLPPDAAALVRIAGLFEKQGQNDSARVYISRALKLDSSSSDAWRAKLMFTARTGAADSLLKLSAKAVDSPATASIVEDALLTFLTAAEGRSRVVDSSWVLCARAWATMRLGPTSFSLNEDGKLRSILARSAEANVVLAPILDAYRPRAGEETYRNPSQNWWLANDGRRSAWSHMLRSLGDSYNATGNTAIAASYYEAAVGLPNPQFEHAWVDLDALLPLALIYAQRAEGRARTDDLVKRVDELTNMLFYGKMRAIEDGDYQRIRIFHMTLGAMFAAQERWGDGPRGAVYQLENMRKMTTKANEKSHAGLTDPPELLEKLAKGYQVTGNAAQARSTAVAAVSAYQRLGKTSDAARVSTQFGVARPPR
jgi:tetratricopeptide (TPR) repeat protein